jgi:hypothetical protein
MGDVPIYDMNLCGESQEIKSRVGKTDEREKQSR